MASLDMNVGVVNKWGIVDGFKNTGGDEVEVAST
jgi:hypothetical protein